jgi:RimJ/RimL family protein N-acetyltransferase
MVRVFAHVAEDNKKAMKLDKHLGFKELYRVENGWSQGVALIVLTMAATECRWLQLKEKHNELKAA